MEVTHDEGGGAPAAAEGDQGGAAAFDPAPIQEHIDRLGQTLEERLGQFEQRLPPQEDPYTRDDYGQFAQQQQQGYQQPGQMPGQGIDPNGLPPGAVDEYGDLTPMGQQHLIQQSLGQALGPIQQQNQQLQQQIQEMQMDAGAAQLESQFPELKDPAKAEALVAYAAQTRPDLVGDVGFLRMAYMAQRAEAAAAGESPAEPSPTLEPAGSASLSGGEPSPQQQIIDAGTRNKVWGF